MCVGGIGFHDWQPPLMDSANSNYIDENVDLPMLSSGMLDSTGYHIDLGNCQLNSRSPFYNDFYFIKHTSTFGDFSSIQVNGGYLILRRNATGEIIDTVATNAHVLEGGDIFWNSTKTFNDKKQRWDSDVSFWDAKGLITTFHLPCVSVNDGYYDLYLMKRMSKSYVQGWSALYNLKTKKMYKDFGVEMIMDDRYGFQFLLNDNTKVIGYKIFDLEDMSLKADIPYLSPDFKDDYVEFRKYKDNKSHKINEVEIVRYDKTTFKQIEHFNLKPPKGVNNFSPLGTFKDLILGIWDQDMISHWIVFDMKTGRVVWDKPFDYFKDRTYRMYEITPMMYDHYLVFREASYLEIYDLNQRDERGVLPKVYSQDVPVDVILKSFGKQLYVSDIHNGKAYVSTYDHTLKPVGLEYCFDLERYTDYRGDGVISTRFGIDNDGAWVLWQDGQVRLRHFGKENETPDIDIKLDIPEQIQAIAPAVWNDGKLYFCGIQKDNSTGYLYITDKAGTVKSLELEKIEHQQFPTNLIFENGNIAVNSMIIIVNFYRKTYMVNKVSNEMKEIELKRSIQLLAGDKFIGSLNEFGDIDVYDAETLEKICTGILIGYDKQKIYLTNFEHRDGKYIFYLVEIDIATGKLEKTEKNYVRLDNPGTTFKNAFLNTPYFQTYDGQPIQFSLMNSENNIRLYSKIGNDLFTSNRQRVYKLSPCPTYSVKRTGNLEFEITMTRVDGKSEDFKGQAYLVEWGDDGKAPIISKFDSTKKAIDQLSKGEKATIRFELSDIGKSVEATGKYFALVIESNGLLDTRNSELSKFDKTERPLFDGNAISYEEQKSVVITVWESK